MNGGPKDNANPVIKSVERRRNRTRKRRPIGWEEVERISAGPSDRRISLSDPSTWVPQEHAAERSPEDIAVLHALADVAALTGGSGVSLLRKAGVVIPLPDQVAFPPSFRSPGSDDGTNSKATDDPGSDHVRDALDVDEVFDIIRNIQDPEHPLTLEQLGVVSRGQIAVEDLLDAPSEQRSDKAFSSLHVRFTPTVPHCSMATLIGLSIQVKLHRSLPSRFKVKISIEPGTHQSEAAINKQLQDKERVRAALENPHLLKIINKCIADGMETDRRL